MNVPNALTASRLLLVLPFAWLLFDERPRWLLVALFCVAALTDLFDGLVARMLDQVTPRGAWLDQMVDRAFTTAIVGLLLGHAFSTGRIATASGLALPLLLAFACTRELLSLPAVVLALARGVPLYHVERIGKLATFVQGIALAAIVLDFAGAGVLAGVGALVGLAAATNYTLYVRSALRSGTRA